VLEQYAMTETTTVRVPCAGAMLVADLTLPPDCLGLVQFAHGSGSGRHSPRNRQVAQALNERGFGTLLLDLLTLYEEEVDLRTRQHRFDIPLLARRMVCATRWAQEQPELKDLPIAYFGASTGSAAALIAATEVRPLVRAVISRGGRPDLAGVQVLQSVDCPTLLIVGGRDTEVIELNRAASAQLHCEHELQIVPGATHLFQEPGALEKVEALAGDWLLDHLDHTALHDAH
jgi:dienelactone hydrolase